MVYNLHINKRIEYGYNNLLWLHMVLNMLYSQSICKCTTELKNNWQKNWN